MWIRGCKGINRYPRVAAIRANDRKYSFVCYSKKKRKKEGWRTYGSVRPNLTRGVVGVPERSVRVAKRPGDLIPGDAAIPSKVEDGVLFVL